MAQTQGQRVDDLIRTYAAECDKAYDNQTRGDYTFLGILSTFVHELFTPDEWQTLVALREGMAKVVPASKSEQEVTHS